MVGEQTPHPAAKPGPQEAKIAPDTVQFLRPRNTLLLFATAGLIAGVVTRDPGYLFFALGGIAALLVAFAEARGLLRGLTLRRQHHPRAFQNSALFVSLQLQADRPGSGELILVEDEFPPGNTSRIRRLVEYPMEEGSGALLAYKGTCDHRRGMYFLGPVRLEACDALGFFRREEVVECITRLLVYPEAVELTRARVLGDGVLPNAGLEMTGKSGAGEEFMGLREYRPGDPMRRVHWKSSARHGELLVKELRQEITTLVTFFLDLGRLGLVGVGDQTSMEYGTKCCASLAKRAHALGHQMQLFAIGRKVEHLPPGSGMSHLLSLLDRLTFLKAEGDSGFLAVAADLAGFLPRGSTAVLIQGATTIDSDAARRLVGRLAVRRILPIFVVIDDRAFIKIFREQEDSHAQALPLEETVTLLQLAGARVHLVGKDRSMEQALLQALDREVPL